MRSVGGMPVLGIGTWGGPWGDKVAGGQNPGDDESCIKAIESALELGITHLDTAELYGAGHAEKLISQAITGYDRSKLFITSKVKGAIPEEPLNLSPERVREAAEMSLRRLGTDYFDLYLVHWPGGAVPIAETMAAMDLLVQDGLVRNIGVSNFTKEQMIAAQEASKHKFMTDQVEYNLFCRDDGRKIPNTESELLPYCQKNEVVMTAYKPVALGLMEPGRFPELDSIAGKHGKSIYQVALNWVISNKNVSAVFRTNNPVHMDENLGALSWSLDKEDMCELDGLLSKYPEVYKEHIIRTKGRI